MSDFQSNNTIQLQLHTKPRDIKNRNLSIYSCFFNRANVALSYPLLIVYVHLLCFLAHSDLTAFS